MSTSTKPAPQIDHNPAILASSDRYREQIAKAHGIELFYHYSEAEAAKLLRSSVSTLKRARNDDSIGYIQKGEKSIAYFGYQLVDFLTIRTTCQKPHPESTK